MGYNSGCHTTFRHRYHLVWAPKYRFKVLQGEMRLRVLDHRQDARAPSMDGGGKAGDRRGEL